MTRAVIALLLMAAVAVYCAPPQFNAKETNYAGDISNNVLVPYPDLAIVINSLCGPFGCLVEEDIFEKTNTSSSSEENPTGGTSNENLEYNQNRLGKAKILQGPF